MPDIQMCPGTGCSVKTNCYRCPASGTVTNFHRQVWGGVPGHDSECRSYSPVWREEMPTLEQRLMRVVETFCAMMGAKESTRNNYSPADMRGYIRATFLNIFTHDDKSELADDVISWLKSSMVDSPDVFEIIENNLLGVICLMDTHDGGTRYIDQVVQHFDKPKPKLTILQGNGTVN